MPWVIVALFTLVLLSFFLVSAAQKPVNNVVKVKESLDSGDLDKLIAMADKNVTATFNVLYDWPCEETRDEYNKAVDLRNALIRQRLDVRTQRAQDL